MGKTMALNKQITDMNIYLFPLELNTLKNSP